MKKHGLVYSMVALLAVLLPACTADDDLAPAVKPAEGLTITLETPGVLSRATTEPGSNDLNENTISQAQLLIFNSDGSRTPDGYRSLEFTDDKTEAVIATGDWKNDAQLFDKGPGATYDIYVVANAHEGSTSLQNVETLDGLLSAVDEDADIWKLEGANIGTGTVDYTDKRFAMSGVSSGFVPNEVEDEYTISVTMERLAAKVEVNIFFSDEFKAQFTPIGFNSSLRNYAKRGLWRSDKEDSFTDRGIAGNGADDPMVAALEKNFEAGTAKLVLYTYPTNWGGDVLQETFVLLNMPGYYKEQEGAQSEYKGSNYYKIPVRLGDVTAHQLNRNTIYRVNVTIDRMGQPQLDVPVELKPTYEVIPWTTVTIDVDGGNLNYLELLKDEIIMKNIDESLEQYFTSSSPVTASITEVYYYDKYGAKQTIPRNNNYGRYGISASPESGNFGNLTIKSNIPTNNGIRYIKVTVTNGQDLSKEFTVKQYPLEYIVTVPGWYSYRTDNICGGKVVNWEAEFDKDLDRPVTSDNNFSSKVYVEEENEIYTYNFKQDSWWVSTGWWGQGYYEYSNWKAEKGTRQNGNDNNNMYFVRITKTSSEYVLSVPAMDSNGYTESSSKNNQLVAPAFMIASQLGTVYPQSFPSAKEHCKQYAEKSLAGEVYEDWRLPTEAELKIIDRYQNTDGSVIDEVLGGKYYWAASGKAYETQKGTDGEEDDAYIRCIRTVNPNEPIVEDKE